MCNPDAHLQRFDTSFGYLFGAEDHVMQNWGHCTTKDGRACGDTDNGGGCVDLWRNEGPAFGENGTLSHIHTL